MKATNNPAPIEHRIREGLSRLAAVLRMEDWARAKTAGLNPTQLSILESLDGRPGGLGVKDIAFQLGVSQPTATDSIGALENKLLIAKRASEIDRRAVHICLTDAGSAALRAGDAVSGIASAMTDALCAEDKEKLLVMLVGMIRELQEANVMPVQRMCVSCRHFRPHAHSGAAKPHHCGFVNAAFGRQELRIDCRDHDAADASSRAAVWDVLQRG